MGLRSSAFAAIAAVAILGVAGGAAAANSDSWTDPAGDSKSAADLTTIAAHSDDGGKIVFTLTYANRPAGLTDDDQVQIWLDTDRNASTGDQAGFDYVIVLDKGDVFMRHGTPAGLEDTPQTTLSGSADGRTVAVNASELGNTTKFDFFVRTLARSDLSADDAPDASNQVFVFSLTAATPAKILYSFSPKTPKAGKTFAVAVLLVTLDDGTTIPAQNLTCTATLNGKPIAATVKPLRCIWKLPKSAKGKRLAVTVVIDNNGSKGSFSWKLKVR